MSNLPDFLVIGAMKSGTTSLHDYLGMHPEIFTSEVKEINFFNTEGNMSKGLDWYKQHFRVGVGKIKGESSQSYTRRHLFPGVPSRIHSTLPNVKLIYLLRDPIERIESHYYESVSQGQKLPKDFASYLIDNPDNNWINTSKYYWQLEEYLGYFSQDQILIITAEDLKSDKLTTMNKVFRFLEVTTMRNGDIFEFDKNTRSEKAIPIALSKNKLFGGLIRSFPLSLRQKIKNAYLTKRVINKRIKRIEFSEEEKAKLKQLLYSDIKSLKGITDTSLNHWSF